MCILIIAAFFAAVGLAIFGPAIFSLLRQLRPLQRLRDSRLMRSGADRHRIRFAFASIWTNALGLGLIAAVIFLVGAAHLGFEIWRHYSGESISPSTAKLEELLDRKMLGAEVLERQHQEVVRAIRNASSPEQSPPGDSFSARLNDLQTQIDQLKQGVRDKPGPIDFDARPSPAVSSFFSIVSFVVVFALFSAAAASWAFLYFLRRNGLIPNWAYRGMTTAVTLGSLAGGVTLLKEVSVVKSADALIKISITNQPQPPTPLPAQELNVHLYHRLLRHSIRPSGSWAPDCGSGDTQRVGPFKDASHILSDEGQKKFVQVVELLKMRGQTERLISITLAGSADKRPLKPETTRLYSSNEGLAQARIREVKSKLLESFDPDTIQIMDHYSGPSNVGLKKTAKELAADRAVQVCVFWAPKI